MFQKLLHTIKNLFVWPANYTPSAQELIMLHDLHNAERKAAGLSPLNINPALSGTAQSHAQWMAWNQTEENGVTLGERMNKAGYYFRLAGENIAVESTPQIVFQKWMSSTRHRENILESRYKDVGYGISESNGQISWCVN